MASAVSTLLTTAITLLVMCSPGHAGEVADHVPRGDEAQARGDSAGEKTGSIAGRLLSVPSGSASGVAGIRLRLSGAALGRALTLVTLAGGQYTFSGLAPGVYVLRVETPGLESQPATIELSAGEHLVRDIAASVGFQESTTVTATRTARPTEEVAAAVTVIGEDAVARTSMTNIKNAIVGTPGTLVESSNQGYDARLIIRGAGLKARYGVREVMLLLNGIPITDPDSLTRLDFVDTHIVDRIEVVRGPNSTLWGINATGGAINIVTKSPFAAQGGGARLDVGSYDSRNMQIGYTGGIAKKHYFNVNFSRRQSTNGWREWNKFDTTQLTLQPSWIIGNNWTWENFLSYTEANLQLPGGLSTDASRSIDQWASYMESGKVERTAEPWKNMSRNSKILFFGSKVVKNLGKVQLKPVLYLNWWKHFHPVTARINDAHTLVGGVDLQADYSHRHGTLTAGVTYRNDDQDSSAYTYADVRTVRGRIVSTLSAARGERASVSRQETALYGIYAQESLRLGTRWLLDLGVRYDRIRFGVTGHEWIDYDWSQGTYVAGPGPIDTAQTYTAFSPRLGVVAKLHPALHAYASVSTGTQTPTSDELTVNPALSLTRVTNYEIGLKVRRSHLTLDTAVYYSPVRDEVVQVIRSQGESEYANAGATEKKGLEVALTWTPWSGVSLGGGYTYSDYRFKDFSEPAFGRNVDRSGNALPYIPKHYYSLSAGYRHPSGAYAQASANTWGKYWMDNANSQAYRGYRLVTDLSLGYRARRFDAALIAQNLFDRRYAVEAQRDLYGGLRYSPAAPRALLARLAFKL